MSKFPITEGEAEAIINTPKQIINDVSWSQKSKSWTIAKLPVEIIKVTIKGHVDLLITVNTELPSKFSFTLLLNGAFQIRRLDIGGSHLNTSTDKRTWKHEIHKHKWSEEFADSHAYTPLDITEESIQQSFTQFCSECNIVFKGQFHNVITQPQMPGV